MTYLIFGKNGQLAAEFIRRFSLDGTAWEGPDEAAADITDPAAVDRVVGDVRPSVILNCAAYNLVDKAETDRDTAFRVNADGPRNLARAADRFGARLVHFSSDYVFNGSKEDGLYAETDATAPLNIYGSSKLAGEQAVRETLGDRGLVLRLSWVFGKGKQNFIFKFQERVRSGAALKVTCDEFSVPTWTGTIVPAVLKAVDRQMSGLYHLTNSGYCSRYEWAKLILRTYGFDRFILPVTMDSFNLPAKRPRFSAMNNGSLSRALGMGLASWEEGVEAYIREERTAGA